MKMDHDVDAIFNWAKSYQAHILDTSSTFTVNKPTEKKVIFFHKEIELLDVLNFAIRRQEL